MNMPGFTAESSLHGAETGYMFNADIDYLDDESTFIYPQVCNWREWLGCGTKISLCSTVCSFTGPIGWSVCMAQCLVIANAYKCVKCLQ